LPGDGQPLRVQLQVALDRMKLRRCGVEGVRGALDLALDLLDLREDRLRLSLLGGDRRIRRRRAGDDCEAGQESANEWQERTGLSLSRTDRLTSGSMVDRLTQRRRPSRGIGP
jgi:hypothetical protein